MMRLVSGIIFFACIVFTHAENTPLKVTSFYEGMNQLEMASSYDDASLIQQNMAACFMASELSGINLNMDDMGEMTSGLYTMKLFSLLYDEKAMKASCDIIGTEAARQPDQNKGMEKKGTSHLVTHVKKTYIQEGVPKTYYDVVTVLVSNGLITEMSNETAIENTTVIPDRLSVEQLRSRAAYCYSKGLYAQAYDYYEQLVKVAPADGDAAYRIALLTFWRKGCKDRFSKKAAQDKAKDYIRIAIKYGDSEISEKASNVSANWENRNVYF